MYKLKHSVRAHGDPDFQQLQAITRMCPFKLLSSSALKDEFFQLAGRLTYVPDWNNRRIGRNMMQAFSREKPEQRALRVYHWTIMKQMGEDGETYQVAASQDTQSIRGSNRNWDDASK